jgi:hypothetical protein
MSQIIDNGLVPVIRVGAVVGAVAGLLPGCPAGPKTSPRRRAEAPVPPRVVSGSAKVFTGGNGIEVTLLNLQDGPWLVRITGTTSKVDGKVLPAKLTRDGVAYRFWETPYDGRDYRIITLRMRRLGNPTYRLSVPGEGYMQNIRLRYDQVLSEKLDPAALWRAHRAQREDGTLAELQRFHVKEHLRRQERHVANVTRRMNERCRAQVEPTIDWSSIPEKTPDSVRVRNACSAGVSALRHLCRWKAAREVIGRHVKRYRCRIGDELSVKLAGDTLVLTVPRRARNRDVRMREVITEQIRWGGGDTLAQRIFRERTRVCTDGKGSYVGLRPRRDPKQFGDQKQFVFYGTAKKLIRVPRPRQYQNGEFWDPRHLVHYPGTARGWNPRYRPRVEYDVDKNRCAVWCGKRRIALRPLSQSRAEKLLARTEIKPPLSRRRPYGLARDRRGIYYYVDRAASGKVRDYRLYRGPLGKLTRLKMVNIVSDTEGDVFSTQNGSLRLVLEKEHSYWVRKGRKRRLINVPIKKNLPMIFNELGVYLGKPYGTPCDLF